MRKIKRIALQTVLFSMEEIKINLEKSMEIDDVKCNAEAIKTLAEAFSIIAKS